METGQPYILKLAESNWREQLSNWYSNTLSEEDRRTLQAGLVGAVGGGATLGLSAHRARRKDGSKRGVLGQIILGMLAGGASTASLAHLFSGQLSNVVDRFKVQPDEAPAPETPPAEAGQRQVGKPLLADRVGDGQTALGADTQYLRRKSHDAAVDYGLYGGGAGLGVGLSVGRKLYGPHSEMGRLQEAIRALPRDGTTDTKILGLQNAYADRFKTQTQPNVRTMERIPTLRDFKNKGGKKQFEAWQAGRAPNPLPLVEDHLKDTTVPGIKKWNIPARLKRTREYKQQLHRNLTGVAPSKFIRRGLWALLPALAGSYAQRGLQDQFARQVGNTDFQFGK